MNQRRFGGVVWLGLVWLLIASRAHAQTTCVQIEGALPEQLSGCAAEQVVCESYRRALAADGGDPGSVLPLRVHVSGPAVADAAASSALELDVFSGERWLGHRELSVRARDCAALPEALALVLALLAREAAQAPPPRAADTLVAAPASGEPGKPRSTGTLSVGAGAGMFFAALPSAALALQLQAATLAEPVNLRARATLLWPQEQRIAEGYVRMHDYELALEACGGFRFRDAPRLGLRLCAGPRAGFVLVRAGDFRLVNESATKFLLYFGLMPELTLAVASRTSLELGAAVAGALVRPRIGVLLDGGARVSELSTPGWIRLEFALRLVQIF